MSDIAALVANNLDIWTGAIERKSGAGRGGGKRINLYGIERLRALILDLAVRGKLVPQDSAEESAVELLRNIRKERAASKQVGKSLKAGEGGERLLCSETETPQGWATVRLSDVILGNVGGGTPSKAEPSYWGGDIPWASVKDVGKNKFVSDTQDRITELGLAKSSANLVPAGNIILVTRMGLGQLSINTIDLAINQDLRAIFLSKHVDIGYCYNYFLTCEIEGAGMTVKGIKLDDLLGLPFPLPPLAEQRRIVAKVDELMALCDALERESADALTAHQTLVEALLSTLVNSDNAAGVAANWARLERHFDTIFTTEASIDALKQTVLDLAVRGILVEQDVEDEPASKLIERIARSRATGSYKKRATAKSDKSSTSRTAPFGWEEVQVGDVFSIRTGFAFKSSTYSPEGTLVFRVTNFDRDGTFDLSNSVYFPSDQIDVKLSRFLLEEEDIVMVMVGGTIGKTTIIDNSVLPALLNQNMWRIRSFGKHMFGRYEFLLVKMLNSKIEGLTQSTHGHFAMGDFAKRGLMIPPLAEQKRIVAKVDELMALCDALKARLSDAAETRRHLADAIVERAAA